MKIKLSYRKIKAFAALQGLTMGSIATILGVTRVAQLRYRCEHGWRPEHFKHLATVLQVDKELLL